MNNDELYKLIDRYFNAETTVEEECLLRTILLSRAYLSAKQKEALAVMSYCAIVPKKKWGLIRLLPKYASVVGATILLIVSFSILFGNRLSTNVTATTCIAYVEGVEINDKDEVMQLVSGQLAEISSVSDEMTEEVTKNMNELKNALNLD